MANMQRTPVRPRRPAAPLLLANLTKDQIGRAAKNVFDLDLAVAPNIVKASLVDDVAKMMEASEGCGCAGPDLAAPSGGPPVMLPCTPETHYFDPEVYLAVAPSSGDPIASLDGLSHPDLAADDRGAGYLSPGLPAPVLDQPGDTEGHRLALLKDAAVRLEVQEKEKEEAARRQREQRGLLNARHGLAVSVPLVVSSSGGGGGLVGSVAPSATSAGGGGIPLASPGMVSGAPLPGGGGHPGLLAPGHFIGVASSSTGVASPQYPVHYTAAAGGSLPSTGQQQVLRQGATGWTSAAPTSVSQASVGGPVNLVNQFGGGRVASLPGQPLMGLQQVGAAYGGAPQQWSQPLPQQPVYQTTPPVSGALNGGGQATDLQGTLAMLLARMELNSQEDRRLREQELVNQRNMVTILAGRLTEPASSSSSSANLAADILNPTRGRVGILPNLNPAAAREAGATLPPLYSLVGDLSTIDMTSAKHKLKSGMNPAEQDEVLITEQWPNQFLPRMLMGGKVNHCDLDQIKLAYGLVAKVYCEAPKELVGTPLINKLRIIMALFRVALVSPWADVLALDQALFQALERRAISWVSWPDLELWWSQSMDMMRTKQAGSRAMSGAAPAGAAPKRPAETPTGAAPPAKAQKRAVMGVPGDWLRQNHICIKFNLGRCTLPAPHESLDKSGNMLRHLCGGCLFLKKGQDGGHGMSTCPNKPVSGVFA